MNVPHLDKTITALQFDTDRAPYVVKSPLFGTPGGGAIACEVPWRGSTSVRSAKREELLLLLAPLQHVPEIELLDGSITLELGKSVEGGYRWRAQVQLYVIPHGEERLVIPLHRCNATIAIPNRLVEAPLHSLRLSPPYQLSRHEMTTQSQNTSKTIEGTPTEILIYGPGAVCLSGEYFIGGLMNGFDNTIVTLRLRYRPAGIELSTEVVFQFPALMRDPREMQSLLAKWAVG